MQKNKAHSTRIVDAALISAMKSGSTYLADICSKHPDIFMIRKPKFNDGTITINLDNYDGEKLLVVRRNMKPIKQDAKVYHSHNENMKFVMLIRNPVQRAFSQFVHHIRKHLMYSKPINVHPQSINKNIYDINKDIKLRKDQYIKKEVSWINKSEFYFCLSPYLELFPRENFFIQPLELFSDNPEYWIKKVFAFLNVPIMNDMKNLKKKINTGKYKANLLDKIIKRNEPEFIPLTDYSKKFLFELFINDVNKMVDLTGIDLFSTWNLNKYKE